MDFVWQYIYGDSAWRRIGLFNELEYSIRSVKKNFQGDYRLFVVGDEPPISHKDVIHIKGYPRVDRHPSQQRQTVDQFFKKKAMVESDLIGENFVMMYDDMFILQPITEHDLKINWALAEIDIIEDYMRSPIRKGDITYLRVWKDTYEGIKMMRDLKGLKTYDWETHTPRYFNKEKLKKIIDSVDFEKNPKIVSSIYDGLYAENTQIITDEIQSDMWSYKPGLDFDKEFSKIYMNIYDDVIVIPFIDHMVKMFGDATN